MDLATPFVMASPAQVYQPPSVKSILLILPLALSVAIAAEPVRTWTDTQGRTLEGTLKGKTETSAEILLKNGNRVTLPLSKLSEADQEYVEAADVYPDPILSAATASVKSNAGNTKKDARAVKVKVQRVNGRDYKIVAIWLGDGGNKGKMGVYRIEEFSVSEDTEKLVDTEYVAQTSVANSFNYRGYAIGLLDESGEFGPRWVAKNASQKPFERFLDDWLANQE